MTEVTSIAPAVRAECAPTEQTKIIPPFHTLAQKDLQTIHQRMHIFRPYSDFSPLSLWSYNTKGDHMVSFPKNGGVCLGLRHYLTGEPFYTGIYNSDVEETTRELLLLSASEGRSPTLKLIPEETATILAGCDDLLIQEDRDNFDYIFSVPEIATLSGSRYHKQKNYVNKFTSLYPHVTAQEIDLNDPISSQALTDIFDRWKQGKDSDISHEQAAILRTLQYQNEFNLMTIGLFDQAQLIGYIISADTGVHNGLRYAETHFAKADTNYKGIFPMLYYKLALYLKEKAFDAFNNEQDLGIEGLRMAKTQMQPSGYLKKYTVSFR